MKGKRWELPQKFRTIYWQNFALTASIVMLTLALLGASFFALSYAYAADERSDEMAQKASVVARLVASYASSGDVRDMREMAGVAASMTDVDFLVCSTEGSVLLTTDENLVDHVLTVPSDVMETALSGERYSAHDARQHLREQALRRRRADRVRHLDGRRGVRRDRDRPADDDVARVFRHVPDDERHRAAALLRRFGVGEYAPVAPHP